MKTLARLCTGFLLLAFYRATLSIGRLIWMELETIWGERTAMILFPMIVIVSVICFGFVVEAYFDRTRYWRKGE